LDVLSKQEIQGLEDAAQTERDKLIARLLADTGLRLGELVGLRTTDVVRRGREAYLQVRGKGERDRLVPINRLQHRVERFIQHSRPKDSLSDHLFLASRPHGSARGYEALTTRGVHQLIRTLVQKVELGKRVYPHLLRHSFATSALAIQLADILGHRSLVMIQQGLRPPLAERQLCRDGEAAAGAGRRALTHLPHAPFDAEHDTAHR
jgi:site-specific recombinase XerD